MHAPGCTPPLALELAKYQTILAMLFSQYPASHCLRYDRLFRQAAAHDPTLRWDELKEDVYVWCFTRHISPHRPTDRRTAAPLLGSPFVTGLTSTATLAHRLPHPPLPSSAYFASANSLSPHHAPSNPGSTPPWPTCAGHPPTLYSGSATPRRTPVGGPLCPYATMARYLAGGAPTSAPAQRPLFTFASSCPLTRSGCLLHLRRLLHKAHYPSCAFNTHSFHIGAATTVAQVGVSAATIKRMSRWRSDAYRRYVRTRLPALQRASSRMARWHQPPL